MVKIRFSSTIIIGLSVAVFFGTALYLRIVLPYDYVFGSDWIKFTSVDAYYHMRLVDNLIHHFPQLVVFDPYTYYPHGTAVFWPPLFDWLLAAFAWLVGFGSPSQHTVDVVGVYFPAVLGALVVIPVYFVGKVIFNRWVGVLSAGLIAFLPGEILGRSILGFTDHHMAEVLFTTLTMLFLVLAVKTARERQLAFAHFRRRRWEVIARPFWFSLLAGVFFAFYLLTWAGGLLFVLLLFVYFVVQFVIDHLKHEKAEYLGIVGTLMLVVACAISLPVLRESWYSSLNLPSFAVLVLTVILLTLVSRVMNKYKVRVVYYPLGLLGLGVVAFLVFYLVNPSLVSYMVYQFQLFTPAGTDLTILEEQPLFKPYGDFSFSFAWGNFTTGLYIGFISLCILGYCLVRRGDAGRTLLIVWSLVMLVATLGQVRFAYYFAVNVAILGGYFCWRVLRFAGFKEPTPDSAELPQKVKTRKDRDKKPSRTGFQITGRRVAMVLVPVAVFFLVYFPNIQPAVNTASRATFTPDDAWCSSLEWLRENTPEPFDDAGFYY